MEKFLKKLSLFALAAMVGLGACKDDDSESPSCQNGSFEMVVNGEHEHPSTFNNTLLKADNAKRMDIRATDSEGRQFIITLSDQSTGTSGNGISTDDYIPFDQVLTGTENTFFFTIIVDDMSYSYIDGNLDITACDASKQQVSGTFSFADENFEVTSGSFTNMCYSIQ